MIDYTPYGDINNQIFEFRFPVISKNLYYTVYSTNPRDIELFLKQHNMIDHIHLIKPVEDNVTCHDKLTANDDDILSYHRFKSNNSNDVYNIMTTNKIVYDASVNAINALSKSFSFGLIICEDKIDIIAVISELIDGLKFGFISEFAEFEYDESHEWSSGDLINDCLFHIMEKAQLTMKDSIEPITIESYIASFVSLLSDTTAKNIIRKEV